MEDYKLTDKDIKVIFEEFEKETRQRDFILRTGSQGAYQFDQAITRSILGDYIKDIAPSYDGRTPYINDPHSLFDIIDKIKKFINEIQ